MGVDERFYQLCEATQISELTKDLPVDLSLCDASLLLKDASPISEIGPHTVSFLKDPNRPGTSLLTARMPGIAKTLGSESAIITNQGGADWLKANDYQCQIILTDGPKAVFSRIAERLIQPRPLTDGDHEISPDAHIHETAFIAPHVTIGAGCVIGPHARIDPFTIIGTGTHIGAHTHVAGHAHIAFADIGAHVQVLPGARIGTDGFGTAPLNGRHIPVAHFGSVIVHDHVTIGANTTVDRGMFEPTIIGENTRIDNLVQVAHNVRIGKDCLIAGCCGISGSVDIGDNVILGGSVGIADHVSIGDGASLAGATLVMRDVPAGETWAGSPAKPIKLFFREVTALNRLATRKRGK